MQHAHNDGRPSVTAPEGGHADDPAPDTAQAVDPREEDAYWRENYLSRPYADDTLSYDHYRPAYRYGWESRTRHAGLRWDEVERDLERGWRENRGTSRLGWTDARLAARDAWQRVEHRLMDERERSRNGTDPDAGHGDPADATPESDAAAPVESDAAAPVESDAAVPLENGAG
jgi:hypothetical protein